MNEWVGVCIHSILNIHRGHISLKHACVRGHTCVHARRMHVRSHDARKG